MAVVATPGWRRRQRDAPNCHRLCRSNKGCEQSRRDSSQHATPGVEMVVVVVIMIMIMIMIMT